MIDNDVSVLLPVLNGEKYLGGCLLSLLAQDCILEIIIVDNGSTDHSVNIIQNAIKMDSRIKLFFCESKGVANALNFGLAKCSGQFIARIDSDDLMINGRLRKQAGDMAADSALAIVSSQVEYINSEGDTIGFSKYPIGYLERSRAFCYSNPIAHPAVMFRLDFARKVGGYRSDYEGAEDLDLWIRLAKIGKILSKNEILTKYRIHETQISNVENLYQKELFFRRKEFLSILKLNNTFLSLVFSSLHLFNLYVLRWKIMRLTRRKIRSFILGK